MYAVIKSGGKQYRVREGQTLRLEKLPGNEGESVTFDQVLFLGNDDNFKIGNPCIEGATVTGKIKKQGRAKKVRILKMKRRKHHMKRMGHRQYYVEVEIQTIA